MESKQQELRTPKTSPLREEAEALFTDMGLVDNALFSAWAAFEQDELGTVRTARSSFAGRNPGGLFLFFIGRGDHKRTAMNGTRRTGYRWVRGSHGGTFVRDVRGVDPLPSWYDA